MDSHNRALSYSKGRVYFKRKLHLQNVDLIIQFCFYNDINKFLFRLLVFFTGFACAESFKIL